MCRGQAVPSSCCPLETKKDADTIPDDLLVQGLVGIPDALACFVLRALSSSGWAGVAPEQVTLRECSGHEGRTFRVSDESGNAQPPVVALHVLNAVVAAEPLAAGRMAVAQQLFAEHGLAPKRLAEGAGWFIDAWAGGRIGSLYDFNRAADSQQAAVCLREGSCGATVEELGNLLARVHSLPTGWYDEIRQQLCVRDPGLCVAALNSHVWPFAARRMFLRGLPDEGLRTWCAAGPRPISTAGARLVTSHSDFHPANIVRDEEGLKMVDFGLTCVTCAAKDMAWACEFFLRGLDEKRRFAEAYLRSSGLGVSPEEVDELLLDVECYSLHGWWGALYAELEKVREDPVHGLDDYQRYADIAEDATASHELRQDILEKGFFRCSRAAALE